MGVGRLLESDAGSIGHEYQRTCTLCRDEVIRMLGKSSVGIHFSLVCFLYEPSSMEIS